MEKLKWRNIAAATGVALTIALLLLIGDTLSITLLMAPFGASCMIAYTLPDSPLSRSRSIIGGHMICTTIGLTIVHTLGTSIWATSLAVGLSILAMQLTRTNHPPACADPLIVVLSNASWSFLFSPVLAGAVIIALFSYCYRKVHNAAIASTAQKSIEARRNNDNHQQEQVG